MPTTTPQDIGPEGVENTGDERKFRIHNGLFRNKTWRRGSPKVIARNRPEAGQPPE